MVGRSPDDSNRSLGPPLQSRKPRLRHQILLLGADVRDGRNGLHLTLSHGRNNEQRCRKRTATAKQTRTKKQKPSHMKIVSVLGSHFGLLV